MLRKFRVNINDKEYMVEMEELTETPSTTQHEPIAKVAPLPKADPKPLTPPVEPVAQGNGEAITAPMPGNILDIRVSVGESVVENQVVAVLEAMKMENEIVAPRSGTITAISTTKGSTINVGEAIVYLT